MIEDRRGKHGWYPYNEPTNPFKPLTTDDIEKMESTIKRYDKKNSKVNLPWFVEKNVTFNSDLMIYKVNHDRAEKDEEKKIRKKKSRRKNNENS